MRIRLILAASFSVLLIIFAAWSRFSPKIESGGELVAIENKANSAYENIYTSPSLVYSASSTAESLTNTDIISRQMFMDYINLSATGNTTEEGIDSMANRYVDAIPSIQASFYDPLDIADIKTISNLESNFEKYETSVRQVHEKYGQEIKSAYPGNTVLINSNINTYVYFNDLSSAYMRMAEEIKILLVPLALSSQHLRLINNYFSVAKAMEVLAKTGTDPATAVAAIATINDNIGEQSTIINEINQILLKNTI